MQVSGIFVLTVCLRLSSFTCHIFTSFLLRYILSFSVYIRSFKCRLPLRFSKQNLVCGLLTFSGHLAHLELIILLLLISLLYNVYPCGINSICFSQHFAERGDKVGVMTGRSRNQGLISFNGKRFFSSLHRLYRLYRRRRTRGEVVGAWNSQLKLTSV